jgi:hypothetical protein
VRCSALLFMHAASSALIAATTRECPADVHGCCRVIRMPEHLVGTVARRMLLLPAHSYRQSQHTWALAAATVWHACICAGALAVVMHICPADLVAVVASLFPACVPAGHQGPSSSHCQLPRPSPDQPQRLACGY